MRLPDSFKFLLLFCLENLIQKHYSGEQDVRGVGGGGAHLSPLDTSGTHLQTQKCTQTTSWEQTGVPDQWERIYRTMEDSVGGRSWGGNWSVNRTGPALGRWGNWSRGPIPHIGATVWVRGETFKAESETAGLWQPKWNENQTVLVTAIHTPDRDSGPLDGTEAGSWRLGIVAQSQGEGCWWLQRDEARGCEGGDCGGKCLWRKARQPWKQGDTAESHIGDWAFTIASLSPHASVGSWTMERLAHQTPDTLNSRVGPIRGVSLSAWCANLQSRTPARGASPCAWCAEQQRRTQAREPSKCLKGRGYAERLAILVTSYERLKRDTDRAMTPAAGAVGVPHAWCPNGPHKPRGRATFTLSSHWDADVTGKKLLCLYVQGCVGRVQLCDPVDCHMPGFCQGASPGENTGAYWPILFAISF